MSPSAELEAATAPDKNAAIKTTLRIDTRIGLRQRFDYDFTEPCRWRASLSRRAALIGTRNCKPFSSIPVRSVMSLASSFPFGAYAAALHTCS